MGARLTSRRLDYLWLALALLLLWQAAHQLAGPNAVATPADTAARAWELLGSRPFWHHVGGTAISFLYASALALVGGLVMGLAFGAHRFSGEVAEPILIALYSIPKIMLFPVILLVFGISMWANVVFGLLHGIFPVALFAMNGVRKVPGGYLKTARVFRLSPWSTVGRVLVPAALPEIVAGLRIGFSITLLGTLIGELFASARGLGFLLIRAMDANAVQDILALTVLVFAFAATANGLLLVGERRIRRGT
jgi:NitT/TauT family transport system permease protein